MSEEQTSLPLQAEHDRETEPDLFEERFPPGLDEETQNEILKDLGFELQEDEESGDDVDKKLTPFQEKLQRLEKERDDIARARDGILSELQDMRQRYRQMEEQFQAEAKRVKDYVGLQDDTEEQSETEMLKQQLQQMQYNQYQAQVVDFIEKAEQHYAGIENDMRQKYEDYDDVIDRARDTIIQNLRNQGLATDVAERVFEVEKYKLVAQAASNNVNFPEWAYQQAKQIVGEQAPAPNRSANAPKQGARKQGRRPTSLSQIGGSGGGSNQPASTLEKLADEDPDKFAKIMADDNLRRKWMQR